ncbi:MAG: hypothetical protein RLY93_18165 [Sumerlaeia bacterium]
MIAAIRMMLYLLRESGKRLPPAPDSAARFQARAFPLPDGRSAWRRDDALAGLDFLARDGCAILAVQPCLLVEFAHPGQTASAYLLDKSKRKTMPRWTPDPMWDEGAESWEDFSARTRAGARAFITAGDFEAQSPFLLRKCVYYVLEVLSREDYLED